MLIISDTIRPTVERFRARATTREANIDRIGRRHVLAVDDPLRVGKRLGRLQAQSAGSPSQERLGLERIVGENDLMPVRYFERGVQVARSIGRVQIRSKSGQTIGYGTGGLVGPQLMITNHHVLSDAAEASTSRIEFDFEEDTDGARRPTIALDLDATTFFVTNKALDVTGNCEVKHEQLFFEDAKGGNIGWFEHNRLGPDLDYPANQDQYIRLPGHYDDALMREAVGLTLPTRDYSVVGNNCQNWTAQVRSTYWRLYGARTKNGGLLSAH